ncbi:hypothetical protein B0H16DRAFT_1567942 [Mycena metata]|uniref:DUF6533 domain-containing protein n=1 Tax=Mycena metata TaxID=1033252 RepID=A0AAD7ICQ2_9AGAR|nr:hypothetical protein B0H16DRAFT_1567942 [Mycena metata]
MGLDAIFEARLIPSTLCACLTILVYDLLCTLDQEILYVWPRPWSMSTALFLLNRYSPFVDTLLSFSDKFTRMPPEVWLSVLGIMLSEGILMLRTYAIWERKRSVLYFLCGLALCSFVPIVVIVQLEAASLHYIQSDVLGCTLSHAGHVIIFGYMILMISETAIAVLTAIKAYRDLRRSRVPWVLKLYQDGMLFYVYLSILSTANVLVPIFAPAIFANWLGTLQRVLHSVLCSRVLLLILRQRRIVTSGTTRAHAVTTDSDASGAVFSSVVDGGTDGSLFTYGRYE